VDRYFTHEDALASLRYISGTTLDERIVRADLDPGYKDGRQYGRGKSGGQVRDEYREDWDPGRGGYGHLKALEEERKQQQDEIYRADHDYGGKRDVPFGEDEDDQVRLSFVVMQTVGN
jgi:nuclear cap-binding protein subunit 2